MSRLSDAFRPERKALIGYLTVGYPDLATTLKAVPIMERAGCDVVELGIPFSDPIGDGPVIQSAAFRALENGVSPADCIETARQLRQSVRVPLVFMGYYNPVLSYGLEEFCLQAGEAGVNGLIVPDLPPEESGALSRAAEAGGLDLVHLLSPTSTAERIALVARQSRGFIYLVSVAGVTGARSGVPEYMPEFIGRVRAVAEQPLAVGFGVSTPEQAAAMAEHADGVIIGSRLIRQIDEDPSLGKLEEFIRQARKALDGE